MDIIIGLGILLAILGGGYVLTHHKPPTTATGKDLANTLAMSAADAWEAVKRDLPEIVSAEVAKLKADYAAALQRAQTAEADLATEKQASHTRLAAVQAQVGAVISGISSQPASTLVAPAVAAAQAEDAAAVQALAAQINPT